MFAQYIGEEQFEKLETVRLMGYFYIYPFCNFVFKTGFLIFSKIFYCCKLLYNSLKLSKMYEMTRISISIRKYRDGVFWGQGDVSKNMINLFLKCKINIQEAHYFILHFQRVIRYTQVNRFRGMSFPFIQQVFCPFSESASS